MEPHQEVQVRWLQHLQVPLPLLGHIKTQEKHLNIIGALKRCVCVRNNPNVTSFSLDCWLQSLTLDRTTEQAETVIVLFHVTLQDVLHFFLQFFVTSVTLILKSLLLA